MTDANCHFNHGGAMSASPALTQSHIARALDEMLTERSLLAARLDKLDALIAAMRDAFHLPDRQARVNGHANGNGNGHGPVTDDAIRTVLASGALRPGELAARLGVDRKTLRPRLDTLVQRGVVIASGNTASRRVTLAPVTGKPAKEVP